MFEGSAVPHVHFIPDVPPVGQAGLVLFDGAAVPLVPFVPAVPRVG